MREELERSQATVGKTQIAQEKTQAALDKAQSELDQLQERAERQGTELRRVSIPNKLHLNFIFILIVTKCIKDKERT